MTRRSGSSDDEDEDVPRRRPQRSNAAATNYAEQEEDDDDDDVDDGEDEEPPSSSQDEDDDDVDMMEGDDDDDDSEDEEEEEPVARRRAPKRTAASKKKQQPQQEEAPSNARRSSRSTKFTGIMKDPTSDSVQDLFRQQDYEDDDAMEEDEDDAPTKRSVSKKKKKKAAPAKSPKKSRPSHASRKVVHTQDSSGEDDSSEEDDSSGMMEEEDDEEQDAYDEDQGDETAAGADATTSMIDPTLKIQRILASRSETRDTWRTLTATMNSSEVTHGSLWYQDVNADLTKTEERFLCKWSDLSYLHVSWETQEDLLSQVENCKQYLSTFFRKSYNGILLSSDERNDGDYFDPAWTQIDRILDVIDVDHNNSQGKSPPRTPEEEDAASPDDFGIVTDLSDKHAFERGSGRQFLIKWQSANYSEASYEFERDLILREIDYKQPLKEFWGRQQKPTKSMVKEETKQAEDARRKAYLIFGDKAKQSEEKRQRQVAAYQQMLADYVYPNGGQLRDYQAEGVSWMVSNYVNHRSCILADEMGLGKTLQTASFCNLVVQRLHQKGPFLVVVPLSTLSHWQREFINWTGLNTIVYHGSARDRELLREHEFAYPVDRPDTVGANQLYLKKCSAYKQRGPWMATVVITTPEMMVADDWNELACVPWQVLIVDEAHRLKNHSSKLAVTLRKPEFTFQHKILLTGTPIQNDVQEFWTLLNFIDPDSYDDLDAFLDDFGDMKSKETIDELHEAIRPYILRRLKEDVETSVPPKEETLIEVELTILQKQYYRALYEKNVKFLLKNKTKALDGPSLNNLAMQLRKCCNHLFLLNGVEEEVRGGAPRKSMSEEAEFLARGSGKLVLLDKLLPRLKQDGHRILIFSQFKIMLDILEDYLDLRQFKHERIDGSITGRRRQQAIDRFQTKTAKDEDAPFIMLLSTRAGGVGINLTAADTVIIFDSDWNPQNDLQAQARCHRIGQTKNVKVFRLLSRKTYEMQMFHMSSLKMGLDQAVLKGFESNKDSEPTMTKEEVERLLRHGAYDIFNEDKAGTAEAESNDFVQQDIDAILARRSKTVVHSNTGSNSTAKGGTFSKASFKAPKTPTSGNQGGEQPAEEVDIEDPDFWKKIVGEAKEEVVSELKPRKRKKANYSESVTDKEFRAALKYGTNSQGDDDSDDSDDSMSGDGSDDDDDYGDAERARWGGKMANQWKKEEAEGVYKAVEAYGYGLISWQEFQSRIPNCNRHDTEEVQRMCWSMLLLSISEGARDDAAAARKRAIRNAEKKQEKEAAEAKAKSSDQEQEAKEKPESKEGESSNENKPEEKSEEKPAEDKAIQKPAIQIPNEHDLQVGAFRKILAGNEAWLSQVFADAVAYAKKHEPRQNNEISKEEQEEEISDLFFNSLWPALSGRGWKEKLDGDSQIFTFRKVNYSSPKEVMNIVLSIHPELSNMVVPILETIQKSRQEDDEREKKDRENHLGMTLENANLKVLSGFLLRYAPFQLLNNRQSSQRIFLNRRALAHCNCIQAAITLTRRAESQPGDTVEALVKLLSIDHRTTLPHSSWSLKHDALLIRAIAKHGWVGTDKACKEIANDKSIKWGPPFDYSDTVEEETPKSPSASNIVVKPMTETELAGLRNTASRAAKFLNLDHAILDEIKGTNMHLIEESYGLKRNDPEESKEKENAGFIWVVDDDLLMQAATGKVRSKKALEKGETPEPLDLPVKKDLAKRAKTVLLRSIAVVDQAASAPAETVAAPAAPVEEKKNDYGYTIIDQGDKNCILLAELVRGFTKSSPIKQGKIFRMLLSDSHDESLELEKLYRSSPETKDKADEMKKIADQIALIKKLYRTQARQVKNIARVMLGVDPLVRSAETTFPTEEDVAVEEKKAKEPQAKREVNRRDDGSAAERYIARAMKKVADKCEGKPLKFTRASDNDLGVQLSMIETFILSVCTTYGIPVFSPKKKSESETQFDYNWAQMGKILASSARGYHQDAIDKVSKAQFHFRKLEETATDRFVGITKARDTLALARIEARLCANAAKQAVDYEASPDKLAKKTVMMLERIRQVFPAVVSGNTKHPHKLENGLGVKVPTWLAKELLRWARHLEVTDESGKILAFITKDLLDQNPDVADEDTATVAAILDRKLVRPTMSQIAMMTRLRSLFLTSEDVPDSVARAIKASKKQEDEWDRRPSWWDNYDAKQQIQYSRLLLERLSAYGFANFLAQSPEGFPALENARTMRDLDFTKNLVQSRANQLVREWHQIEESNDSLRMLKARRTKSNHVNPAGTASSGDKHGSESGKPHATKKAKSGSVQTGIHSFFSTTKASSKKDTVVLSVDDNASGSLKRKSTDSTSVPSSADSKKSKPNENTDMNKEVITIDATPEKANGSS